MSDKRLIPYGRIYEQYQVIKQMHPGGISLSEMFSGIVELCNDFQVHPDAEESDRKVIDYAQRYQIWLDDNGPHYVTMNAYLHPTAKDEARLTALGKLYIILFFIDDTITADTIRESLSREEHAQIRELSQSLMQFVKTGDLPNSNNSLIGAIREVLADFDAIGVPDIWMNEFKRMTGEHLSQALRDDGSKEAGVLPLSEYGARRLHDSGMYITALFMEVGSDAYVDIETYRETNPELYAKILDLRFICGELGAYINDFFSFHKEVIEARNNFNLITTYWANGNADNLMGAIYGAAAYTMKRFETFMAIRDEVYQEVLDTPSELVVHTHLVDLFEAIRATWVWQYEGTTRYISPESIFRETRARLSNRVL